MQVLSCRFEENHKMFFCLSKFLIKEIVTLKTIFFEIIFQNFLKYFQKSYFSALRKFLSKVFWIHRSIKFLRLFIASYFILIKRCRFNALQSRSERYFPFRNQGNGKKHSGMGPNYGNVIGWYGSVISLASCGIITLMYVSCASTKFDLFRFSKSRALLSGARCFLK